MRIRRPSRTQRRRQLLVGGAIALVLSGTFVAVAAAVKQEAPSHGPIPTSESDPRRLDLDVAPDLVSVSDDAGKTVGFAKKADVIPQQYSDVKPGPIDVWDESGTTLIGHLYRNGGGYYSIEAEKRLGYGPDHPPPGTVTPTTILDSQD